jgi:hypothetical protein
MLEYWPTTGVGENTDSASICQISKRTNRPCTVDARDPQIVKEGDCVSDDLVEMKTERKWRIWCD